MREVKISKKLFRTIGKIAGVVAAVAGIVLAVPTGGASLGLTAGIGGILGTVAAVASVVSIGAGLLGRPKSPSASPANKDRLFASIDPRTPRKMVFGNTAMATDIRDQEYSSAQDYLHRFIVVASHAMQSIDTIYFDDKIAWTLAGGAQGEFAGYLTVTPILEGNAGNAINIGARMGTSRRYTGCAYVHIQYKLTGNTKKTESPFGQSVPTRMSIIGKGWKTYDPRLDSTVAGGSGSHRANDQTTWAWDANASRNPAIQLLNYYLGWKIAGKLAVGKGIPSSRIDLPSFITAANICDESVALAAGGSEPRYRSDGVFSESDALSTVNENFKASMNAELDDIDGKIRLTVIHNDLADGAASDRLFTDDDILGDVDWNQTAALDESFNAVRGTYVDASANSLYQSVDYPQPTPLTSPDGIDRILTFDLPMVQSSGQAQRLAKQALQRQQYTGTLSFVGQATWWRVQRLDVVRLTFSPLGMVDKLFRVMSLTMRTDGTVPVVLMEENSAIYAWSASDVAAVAAAAPTLYDFTKNPVYQDIQAGVLTIRYPEAFPSSPSFGSIYIDATDKQFRFEGTAALSNGAAITSNGVAVADSGWVDVQDAAIAAAANTANWGGITGTGKPADNADVTAQSVPSLTVPATLTITADYLGAVTDELPIVLVCSRMLGTTNVDATTTFSATFPSGIVGSIDTTSADANRGNISIAAATGSGPLGDIVVTAVRDGVTLTGKIAVTKNNAAAPGDGGSGATSATITSYTAPASDTYGSANGGPVTVTAPASGKITVSGSLSYKCTPKSTGEGYYGMAIKAQCDGVDIATEVISSAEAQILDEGDGILLSYSGTITFSFEKTGLVAGTDHAFQVLARRAGTNSTLGSRTITGTTNVNQT